MPNPAIIHTRSVKLNHYLKIVDVYIAAGCPNVFQPEPNFGEYQPDAYMKTTRGDTMCVEVQLTHISSKKMQKKVDQFVNTYGDRHDAKTFLLVSNVAYGKLKIPEGFKIKRVSIPDEVYTKNPSPTQRGVNTATDI